MFHFSFIKLIYKFEGVHELIFNQVLNDCELGIILCLWIYIMICWINILKNERAVIWQLLASKQILTRSVIRLQVPFGKSQTWHIWLELMKFNSVLGRVFIIQCLCELSSWITAMFSGSIATVISWATIMDMT